MSKKAIDFKGKKEKNKRWFYPPLKKYQLNYLTDCLFLAKITTAAPQSTTTAATANNGP